MTTPIFDAVKAQFDDAIKSAEARATLQIKTQVLTVLKEQKKPTVAIKNLIGELENGTDGSK